MQKDGQGSPSVRFMHPPKGMRQVLCSTDEATVCRMKDAKFPRYEGMVERRQEVARAGNASGQTFFFGNGRFGYLFGPDSAAYHIGKFLALRAARALFPANFPDAAEMRLFRERGALHAATYSGFVPDETGVIERRRRAMREYYAARFASDAERQGFKDRANGVERALNPGLVPLAEKIAGAGVVLSHPEANYHVSKGGTVFFEVEGLRVDDAVAAAFRAGVGAMPALEAVSAMYAMLVNITGSAFVGGMSGSEDSYLIRAHCAASETPVQRVHELVFSMLIQDKLKSSSLVGGSVKPPDDFIKEGLVASGQYADEMIALAGGVAAMPAFPISERVMRILRREMDKRQD